MKIFTTIILSFLVQISFGQLLETHEIKSAFQGRTIELDHKTEFSFRDYGDLWFSTLEELIKLGEIPGFDEQPISTPVLIFPDSTIYAGYGPAGRYVANIHGIADVVNPSTLPSDFTKEWYWAKSVVDSVGLPYAYFRNTDEEIVDTVFVDYLNHISYTVRLGHIPLDGDVIPEADEFIHQPILHTGTTDELDDEMVFRTDTIILSSENETTDYARLISINTNDTVEPGFRYGVYVRFKPGYEWNKGNDTITNYNQFGLFMREQDEGLRPRVLWDSLAGFASYLNTINTRYNLGSSSGQLLVGYVGDGSFQYEHAYVKYKITTNELSVPENIGLDNLTLYPNPNLTQTATVSFESIKDQELLFRLFDINGKLISNETRFVKFGENNLVFDISKLSPGVYQFLVEDFAQKLVVK